MFFLCDESEFKTISSVLNKWVQNVPFKLKLRQLLFRFAFFPTIKCNKFLNWRSSFYHDNPHLLGQCKPFWKQRWVSGAKIDKWPVSQKANTWPASLCASTYIRRNLIVQSSFHSSTWASNFGTFNPLFMTVLCQFGLRSSISHRRQPQSKRTGGSRCVAMDLYSSNIS